MRKCSGWVIREGAAEQTSWLSGHRHQPIRGQNGDTSDQSEARMVVEDAVTGCG